MRVQAGLAATRMAACLGAHAAPFAYVTNQGRHHDASLIDLASRKVIATLPMGRSPAGVAAARRIGKLFDSNPDSQTISLLDMSERRAVDTPPAGAVPVGIDAAADGGRLDVSDRHRDRLLILDTAASRTTIRLPIRTTKPPSPASTWPRWPT